MGSFNLHKLRAEKTNAVLKHPQLRKIANLLRYVEVCVVLVLISRLSFQLPMAIKNASEYLRGFSVPIVSPHFVFLVGNVIIITLFAQSGQFLAHGSATTNSEPDIYEEFIQGSTKNQIIEVEQKNYLEKQSIRTGDSIKSKRMDGYLVQSMNRITKTEDRIKDQSTKTGDPDIGMEVMDYRRCQSEIGRRVQSEKPCRVLQRCETENNRRGIEGKRVGKTSYPEDGMSNEEFRRTIEAFIARQQRLRRQEQCLPP